MKIGVRIESLALPLRRAITEISRMGASGLQVDAVGDLAPDTLSATGRREFRHLLRSHDLELTALHCPLRRGLDVPENQEPRIEHIRNVMTLAYDLGCRLTIVEMPAIPEAKADVPAQPMAGLNLPGLSGGILIGGGPSPAQALREALANLGSFGDRIGSKLALEGGLDSSAKVADYLATFDTGSLGVNYDPANMMLNGHNPIGELVPLGRWLLHVHARDARRSGASRAAVEVALGAGEIDWMAFVASLGALEYRGWVVVERDGGDNRLAEVSAGVALLKRLIR